MMENFMMLYFLRNLIFFFNSYNPMFEHPVTFCLFSNFPQEKQRLEQIYLFAFQTFAD